MSYNPNNLPSQHFDISMDNNINSIGKYYILKAD